MSVLDRGILYVGVPLAILLAGISYYQTKNIGPPGAKATSLKVKIYMDKNNNCTQAVDDSPNATPFIEIDKGWDVIWVAANSDAFEVQFPSAASSPFAQYDFKSQYGL